MELKNMKFLQEIGEEKKRGEKNQSIEGSFPLTGGGRGGEGESRGKIS